MIDKQEINTQTHSEQDHFHWDIHLNFHPLLLLKLWYHGLLMMKLKQDPDVHVRQQVSHQNSRLHHLQYENNATFFKNGVLVLNCVFMLQRINTKKLKQILRV